jgi:polyferredoxin
MPNEFSMNHSEMNDPQNIWKNQTTEAFKMSAEQLRHKAQQRQRKSRFEAAYTAIIGLVLFLYSVWAFVRAHEVVPRMGWGLLSLWSIYLAYRSYRWLAQERPAPDAALNPTLQAYRMELEKRRDYARHAWRKAGLTFCFLGMALVVAPALIKYLDAPGLLLKFGPLFVLLAVWCAIFFPRMKSQRQKLQQEIERLRAFENENRSL